VNRPAAAASALVTVLLIRLLRRRAARLTPADAERVRAELRRKVAAGDAGPGREPPARTMFASLEQRRDG
jgi:hypothetical protein